MSEDTTTKGDQSQGAQPIARIIYNGNVYEYYGDMGGLEEWLRLLFTQSL